MVSLKKLLTFVFVLLVTHSFAQVTFQPRANFGQRLESNGKVLHGLGQGVNSPDFINWSNQYMNALGSSAYPFYYMEYCSIAGAQSLINRVNDNLPQMTKPNQYYPLLVGLSLGDGPEVPSDAAVASFAQTLSNWGRPIYLRIGYEFNGSWNKYNNYENYKTTFRKIYNALRAAGAENVATVWCADAGVLPENDVMKWFPGGTYVDWFALDIFDVASITSKQTKDFMALSRSYNKPVMIAESTPKKVGVTDGQADWNTWFRPFFDLIRANPEVKAFSYINWDWRIFTQWADWGDCRINLNATIVTNFRNEMNSSTIYQHAQGEASVRQILRIGQTPSPTTQGFDNLSRNKPAIANGSCNASTEGPAKAVDGGVYTKWCYNTAAAKWLRVDLGQTSNIVKWVVRHAGAAGEPASRNTQDFKLEVSNDGNNFTPVDAVTGNTANLTDRNVSASGRYVRLYITDSGADNAARIQEFEVHGTVGSSNPGTPTEYIVDNTSSGFSATGTWTASTGIAGYYGSNYLHDGNNVTNTNQTATWTSPITSTGTYDVYMRWTAAADRPDAAPIEINYNGGIANLTVNQQANGSQWVKIGTWSFTGGSGDYVRINASDAGYTIADAVRWVKVTSGRQAVRTTIQEDALHVFPNPAQGEITLESHEEIRSVKLVNNLGRTLLSKNGLKSKQVSMSVEHLSSGIYLVQALTEQGRRITRKIVISR